MITISENKAFYGNRSFNLRGELRPMEHPWVMGILNLNPDSFYDGGRYAGIEAALSQTEKMLQEGADLIDLGPASSKPGSPMIGAEEEWERLTPYLKALREAFPQAAWSVDTYNAATAARAIEAGAHMINDISGGTHDPDMARVIGEAKVPFVLMHMQGQPQHMQENPQYQNVTKEVAYFFSKQIDHFNAYGAVNLILDPGFGFGKSLAHNYQLLQNLDLFKSVFNLPLLVGLSRKSMVQKVIDASAQDALNGSTVLHTLALQKGADILRVHDVRAAWEACRLVVFSQSQR